MLCNKSQFNVGDPHKSTISLFHVLSKVENNGNFYVDKTKKYIYIFIYRRIGSHAPFFHVCTYSISIEWEKRDFFGKREIEGKNLYQIVADPYRTCIKNYLKL